MTRLSAFCTLDDSTLTAKRIPVGDSRDLRAAKRTASALFKDRKTGIVLFEDYGAGKIVSVRDHHGRWVDLT
jgi:hypothetical protein